MGDNSSKYQYNNDINNMNHKSNHNNSDDDSEVEFLSDYDNDNIFTIVKSGDDIERVLSLINNENLISINPKNGTTLLMICAEENYYILLVELYNKLIELYSNDDENMNNNNNNNNESKIELEEKKINDNNKIKEMAINLASGFINRRDNNGENCIFKAAKNGHKSCVEFLLNKGGDINALEKKCLHSTLSVAAKNGHLEIIDLIMSRKNAPNIEMVDKYGNTSMMLAASHGHVDTVEYMIEKFNVNINEDNSLGQTALVLAAKYKPTSDNHLRTIKYLCSNGAEIYPGREASEIESNALLQSIISENWKIAQYLISITTDLSLLYTSDSDGVTPLMYATKDTTTFSCLMKKGLETKERDHEDNSILHYACRYGNAQVVELIIKMITSEAVSENNKNFTSMFINHRNHHKETALHIAALYGYRLICDILLTKAHAETGITSNNKSTILHAASRVQFGEITNMDQRLLLSLPEELRYKAKWLFEEWLAIKDVPEYYPFPNEIITRLKVLKVEIGITFQLYFNKKAENSNDSDSDSDDDNDDDNNTANEYHNTNNEEVNLKTINNKKIKLYVDTLLNNIIELVKVLTLRMNRKEEYKIPIDGIDHYGCVQKIIEHTSNHQIDRIVSRIGSLNVSSMIEQHINSASEFIDWVDIDGMPAMAIAAKYGNWRIFKYLLENATDINQYDNNIFGPALLRTTIAGEWSMFKTFLDNFNANANYCDANSDKKCAIHYAAYHGHIDAIKQLGSKVDVESKDNNNESCLFFAARENHKKVIEILIKELNVNLSATNLDGNTILFEAIRNNAIDVVNYIMQLPQVDPTIQNRMGDTSLIYASRYGMYDVVKYLFENRKASIHDIGSKGGTALHWACEMGHFKIVKYLVEKAKATVDASNDQYATPLVLATKKHHTDIVQYLVTKGGASINEPDENQRTALFHAVGERLEDTAMLLLDRGADIHTPDIDGDTVIFVAAEENMHNIVKRLTNDPLLHRRAKKTLNSAKRTPAMLACMLGHIDCLKTLVNFWPTSVSDIDNDGRTLLHLAALFGKFAIVQYLTSKEMVIDANSNAQLSDPSKFAKAKVSQFFSDMHKLASDLIPIPERGETIVNVNAADLQGNTPLHLACGYEEKIHDDDDEPNNNITQIPHLKTVRALINDSHIPVDINVLNRRQQTPLHLAAMSGRLEVLKLLASIKGTNIGAKDRNGNTAIIFAAGGGHLEIVHFLLSHPDYQTSYLFNTGTDGNTALHCAAAKGYALIVTLLIDKMNLKDNKVGFNKFGESPLHLCCQNGNSQTIELLVEHFNPNHRDIKKRTALDVALDYGRLDLVKELLSSKNISISRRGEDSRKALKIAVDNNDVQFLRYLKRKKLNFTNVMLDNANGESVTLLQYAALNFNVRVDTVKILVKKLTNKLETSNDANNSNINDPNNQRLDLSMNFHDLNIGLFAVEELSPRGHQHHEVNEDEEGCDVLMDDDNNGWTALTSMCLVGDSASERKRREKKRREMMELEQNEYDKLAKKRQEEQEKVELARRDENLKRAKEEQEKAKSRSSAKLLSAITAQQRQAKLRKEKEERVKAKLKAEQQEILDRQKVKELVKEKRQQFEKEEKEYLEYAEKWRKRQKQLIPFFLEIGVPVRSSCVTDKESRDDLAFTLCKIMRQMIKDEPTNRHVLLQRAIERNDMDLVNILLDANNSMLPYLTFPSSNQSKSDKFLDSKVYPNMLFVACAQDEPNPDILRALMNYQDEFNMEMITDRDIDNNIQVENLTMHRTIENDKDKQTLLHILANHKKSSPGLEACVELLATEKGSIPLDKKDRHGFTPLMYACKNNLVTVVEMFINAHASINVLSPPPKEVFSSVTGEFDGGRETVLHISAKEGNWRIVSLLLETSSLDVEVVDSAGRTPLCLCLYSLQRMLNDHPDYSNRIRNIENTMIDNDKQDADTNYPSDDNYNVDSKNDDEKGYPVQVGEQPHVVMEMALLDHGMVDESVAKSKQTFLYDDFVHKFEDYRKTWETLESAGASVFKATNASGIPLTELLDVDYEWNKLDKSIKNIELQKRLATRSCDRYFKKKRVITPKDRARMLTAKRNKEETIQQVFHQQEREVFRNQSNQIIISHMYNQSTGSKRLLRLMQYLCFLALLTFISVNQSTRDQLSAHWMHTSVMETIVNDEFDSNHNTFKDIATEEEFWDWINGPFLDTLYSDGQPLGFAYILGRPRIRQVRSTKKECNLKGELDSLASECYSHDNFDTISFGPSYEYIWQSSNDLDGVSYYGFVSTYPGSGYIIDLPISNGTTTSREAAENALNTLKSNSFIDLQTRAIFVEVILFNPSVEHFAVLKLVLEFSTTGAIIPSQSVSIHRLRRYLNTRDMIILVLEIILSIIMLHHIINEARQVYKEGILYFSSAFQLMDLVVSILFIVVFILHLITLEWSQDIKFIDNHYPPANRLAYYLEVKTSLLSIVVLLSWLKLLEYLSVFETLSRLVMMTQLMIAQLTSFMILFLVVLGAFASAEYIAYGVDSSIAYTWLLSFINSLHEGLQLSGDENKRERNRFLGVIYPILFAISVILILLNLVIAIMTSAIEDAKTNAREKLARSQYNTLRYSITSTIFERILDFIFSSIYAIFYSLFDYSYSFIYKIFNPQQKKNKNNNNNNNQNSSSFSS